MDKDKKLLKELYSAVTAYFAAENDFRSNPCDETWNKRLKSDSKLTTTTSRVKAYLKGE